MLKSIAFVIGCIFLIGGVALFLLVAGTWIYTRFFAKNKIAGKYHKKGKVHRMYCDEEGIKSDEVMW